MDELRRRLVPSATASELSGAPATALETILQTPAVAEFLRAHKDAELLTGGESVRCALTNVVILADLAKLKGHWGSKRYRQAAGSGRSLVGGARSRAQTAPERCAVPSADNIPSWHLAAAIEPTLPIKPTVEPTSTTEPTVEPTVEPTAEPTVEPTVEPLLESMVEPTSTVEPTVELTVEPTVEPKAFNIETDEPGSCRRPRRRAVAGGRAGRGRVAGRNLPLS